MARIKSLGLKQCGFMCFFIGMSDHLDSTGTRITAQAASGSAIDRTPPPPFLKGDNR